MDELHIYKFLLSHPKGCDISSIFLATGAQVDATIEKYVYFNSMFGVGSEVYADIRAEYFTKISEIPAEAVLDIFVEYGMTLLGQNPVYIYNNHLAELFSREEPPDLTYLDLCYMNLIERAKWNVKNSPWH